MSYDYDPLSDDDLDGGLDGDIDDKTRRTVLTVRLHCFSEKGLLALGTTMKTAGVGEGTFSYNDLYLECYKFAYRRQGPLLPCSWMYLTLSTQLRRIKQDRATTLPLPLLLYPSTLWAQASSI